MVFRLCLMTVSATARNASSFFFCSRCHLSPRPFAARSCLSYHMLGAPSMKARVLGGYVEHMRALHPDAPLPAVYLADALLGDAEGLRAKMGDDAFFAMLGAGASDAASSGWGDLKAGWNAERYESAKEQGPQLASTEITDAGHTEYDALVSALIKNVFPAQRAIAAHHGTAMVSMGDGLSAISRHAKGLGYDGVVLFLDELILWLASISGEFARVKEETQELALLVESGNAVRPAPIVSFVARQRDLRDFIGESVPGSEQFSFVESLKWTDGRFSLITLEDRNLPEIAQKRLLRPVSEAARSEIDAAFDKTRKERKEVLETLLTRTGDPEMFRKVYPFSPAFMDALVAVSSVLQRERTALKILMILLSEQRESLELGGVVPVGDLWDVIADGDEPFSPALRSRFDQAKELYVRKLEPILEAKYELSPEQVRDLPRGDPAREKWRNDARLMKTLLLAALVTEVESLSDITAGKLAALNHGSIKTRVPGGETRAVLARVREWGGQVGEIKLTPAQDPNPVLSVHLAGVDTDAILEKAKNQDNESNRKQQVKTLLYAAFGIEPEDDLYGTQDYVTVWRGSKRRADVAFANVHDLIDDQLRSSGDVWKVVLDYPFDETGADEQADRDRLQRFRDNGEQSRTLCWLPSYLDAAAMADLGKLVRLEHVLRGDRFESFASELSLADRREAKQLLTNQRDQLRRRLTTLLERAYGVRPSEGSMDSGALGGPLESLDDSFSPRPPVAPTLGQALEGLVHQALASQYPAHPQLGEDEVKAGRVRKVRDEVLRAIADPNGRIEVERVLRADMKRIAEGLKLGEQGDGPFLLGRHWPDHFARLQAKEQADWSVRNLRRWVDVPAPMGLTTLLSDLIVLVFAAQTNRSFYFNGGAIPEPDLLKLDDNFDLREQTLPSADTWASAKDNADVLFGLGASPVCNAANMTKLVARLRELVPPLRDPANRIVGELTDRLSALEMDASAARLRTARSGRDLVERLALASDEKLVGVLAAAKPETSGEAVAAHLAKLSPVREALERTEWGLLESLREVSGPHGDAAQELHAELKEALEHDEYAIGLGPKLKSLTNRTAALFTRIAKESAKPPTPTPTPTPTPPPPAPKPAKGRRVVGRGSAQSVEAAAAKRELDRVRKALDEAEDGRLNIEWSVEGDE